ncbi:MAG: hypothetical protein IJG84_17005 [Kiritimatiellae bacterium]|nr:hypothetical protein [Kiritimatiellia bacterium]
MADGKSIVLGDGHQVRGGRHDGHTLTWRYLSISVSSDASNEVNDVKIVNVLNKITVNIAFKRILCYNHAEKEKKHAA